MAEQEQIKKTTKQDADELAEEDAARQPAEQDKALLDATDDLLDDIDALLEDVTVAIRYVQRGGQ